MKVLRIYSEKHLHVAVLLVHILQVLLEFLQLDEAVVCKFCVLLHFTVHFFKLESKKRRKVPVSMKAV